MMAREGAGQDARILVVDDDPGGVRVLANLLREHARVLVTTRGSEALALARAARPDLVLLDIEMPDADGISLCRELRADPETADALVLFVTSLGDARIESEALAAGAIDFIHKPVRPEIVRARVANYLALKRQADHLRRLTMIDELTGVANRRAFDVGIAREWARAARTGESIALIMADVDHFKQFNDLYGHLAGDACLQSVASALARHARRPSDLLARYGGEEFALLLPDCPPWKARDIAARLLAEVAGLRIAHAGSATASHVTVSLGVASLEPARVWTTPQPDGGGQPQPARAGTETLVGAADAALYRAKHAGRNRAAFAPS
jgi:diguanylate cyclase (GGDEF)-like protein